MKIRSVEKRLAPQPRLPSIAARQQSEAIAFEIEPARFVRVRPPFVRSAAPGVDPNFVDYLCYSDTYKAGAVHCYLYNSAIVMPRSCAVFVRPDLVDAQSLYNIDPKYEDAFVARNGDEFATWDDKVAANAEVEVSGLTVLAGNKYCTNYSHWHHECLPGILELFPRVAHLRPTWLVPRLTPFHVASFEAIGISLGSVMEVGDSYIRCERLALMSSNLEETWISPFVARHLRAYRDRLRGIVGDAAIEKEDAATAVGETCRPEFLPGHLPQRQRLYISRKDTPFRPMENEDDVIELLTRKYRFEAVVNGSLSYLEQAARYADAEIIVGAHGAGLTNSIFAAEGAIVLELRPDQILDRSPFWDRSYLHLAHALGLQYGMVCFSAEATSESWRVDVEHLRHVFDALGWRPFSEPG